MDNPNPTKRGRGRPRLPQEERIPASTPRVSMPYRPEVLAWWVSLSAQERGELVTLWFDQKRKRTQG